LSDDDEDDVVEEEQALQEMIQQMQKQPKQDPTKEDGENSEYFDLDAGVQTEKDKGAKFTDMQLSRPLMRAVQDLGFVQPSPIQRLAIPVALSGKDLCASAQTGSGKTAAFLLPCLERLLYRSKQVASTRVLIITPTRELATQCQSMLEKLGKYTDVSSACIVGGMGMKAQENELRKQPDIVICTPGRMLDHLCNSHSVHMENVEILILDEADRLLELGFTEEVQELVKMCPKGRQTMLFSATMTSKVDQLAKLSLNRPARLQADVMFDMSKNLVQVRPTLHLTPLCLALNSSTSRRSLYVSARTAKSIVRPSCWRYANGPSRPIPLYSSSRSGKPTAQ
jgi:ATP-dependent RNA helicase DDX27